MSKKRHTSTIALSYAFDPTSAERASDNSPPTAFRIWKSGENRYDADGDEGRLLFTERSAALLMEQQSQRNRPYVFDYNHLSLLSENPEAGRAAGWHKLEARGGADGPELWAVDCEWVESVADGMSKEVPEWRFFSPAFSVDPETLEVVSYTNCAITNNPRTHDLPMLAAQVEVGSKHNPLPAPVGARNTNNMDPAKALAVLGDPNSSAEDRAAALEVLSALVASMEAEPKSEPQPAQAAERADEEGPKAEAMASIALAKANMALSKRVEALEVDRLLASKSLPGPVREWASKQPVSVVKSFLASVTDYRPAPDAERKESPTLVEPAKDGVKIPALGTSPVDKVLGIRAPSDGKTGVSDAVDGIRTIAIPSKKKGA